MGDRSADMTAGIVWKQLILFALPLFASSLIQQLYNTVDLIFVGRILGKDASAAVGASSMLVNCLVVFFTGLSTGTGVVVSRYFGAKKYSDLKRTVHTAVAISLGGGVLLTVVGYFLAPYFLGWMNTPGEIHDQALGYVRVYFYSLTAIVGYNICSGVLRAIGDSRSPMIYQLIGGLVNVAANYLFIYIFKWGVKGAAAATLVSQTMAAVLVLIRLTKLNEAYKLQFRHIAVNAAITKEILVVGIPAGIQAMATSLSNLFVQYHINSLGVDVIAAYTVYFKVELFIYLPIMAISQASGTFTGQNIGAGRVDRVKRGKNVCIIIGLCVTVGLCAFMLFTSNQVFSFFTAEKEIIEIGKSISKITFPFYFFYVFLEVYGSTIRGAGKSLPPMVIILTIMCVFRPALLKVMMHYFNNALCIAVIYPVTWFIAALLLGVYYYSGRVIETKR